MSQPDRSKLPIPRQPFRGVANRTLEGSKPDWESIGHVDAPDGAPNVLMVLIDDAGYGNAGTFGGPIDTPNFSRMAQQGLRYNRFHVTPLCSPTRAALLTGRNSHAVGFGSVGEFSTGFPGYTAFVPDDCVPFPRILRDNGYCTSAFGKWHLTPDGQQGPAGPFDRWPVGWGFDYFYGFLGGGSGQWDPCLAENQKIIGTPDAYYDDEGRSLLPARTTWRTRRSSGCMRSARRMPRGRSSPTSPPVAAMPPTTCRKSGRRSTGASSTRAGTRFARRSFARQKEAGVVPAEAELTPRDDAFPAWDDVPDKLKAYLRASDGGLRRLFRERRPQRRPRDRRDRGARGARQHDGDLDLGRQRRQHGGHDHRLLQRADDAERHPTDRRDATAAIRALWRHRGLGKSDDGPALLRRLGMGRKHAIQMGKAGRLPPRRHPQPIGRALAGEGPGRRRPEIALHSRHRRRPDDSRHRRHTDADTYRRDRAATHARPHIRRLADRPRRSRTPHPAVLRDDRQSRHVQGRLVARDEDRADPVGPDPGGPQALHPGRLEPR